eukprot:CAMPEP_0201592780 /NCGR_PEP_ID=MMETSP0190_2-20130828/190581_1 /ASSEMBLY_ACC=CAM_ASM_000263 /TAXON_ID=37353 /ORGANISM="Rosalina sp." /LENGTH=415 /DNA_ID=CAMNT_0048051705 /DNA_START=318 /DNA_END=1562 /DNA_ORIENTATION=-
MNKLILILFLLISTIQPGITEKLDNASSDIENQKVIQFEEIEGTRSFMDEFVSDNESDQSTLDNNSEPASHGLPNISNSMILPMDNAMHYAWHPDEYELSTSIGSNSRAVEQRKQLNGGLSDMKEEKKAAEAVSLYEKQMKAEELLDTTQLDLIRGEEDEMDEDPDDDDYEEYGDIDDELSHVIPEDSETELSAVYEPDLKEWNTKLDNMSISELEPATRLPFHNYASGDLTEGDEDQPTPVPNDLDILIEDGLSNISMVIDNKQMLDTMVQMFADSQVYKKSDGGYYKYMVGIPWKYGHRDQEDIYFIDHDPKYSYLKEVLKYENLSTEEYTNMMAKAMECMRSNIARSMRASPKPGKYGDMYGKGDSMNISHLMCLIMLCDYPKLADDLSNSFRKTHPDESLAEIKKRNQNFW